MRLFILIFAFQISISAYSQSDCKAVKKSRNNNFKEGIAYGEMVSTEDFYTLMYEKIFNPQDTINYPQYMVSMTCAARHPLPDSVLKRTGDFLITFNDQTTITWDKVTCSNMPTLPVWSFELRLTEAQFEILTQKKVRKIKVFQKVETTLSERNQNKLIKIANCLKAKLK